jgi:diketogulonate reductase-like aldo/keto reductase
MRTISRAGLRQHFPTTNEIGCSEPMNLKELGETGVPLPEIGSGTWQYHGGVEPIRKAIALGSSLVDTAESYCTEEIVGEAVRQLRNRVFIATKVSPRHFRRSDVLMAADKSLERLRTDYIDLYQLHWPNCTVPIEETMAAMEDLVDRGKIRFIGVSNFSVPELRKAQTALSKYRVVSNQVGYSLVDRSVEVDLLRYCREHRITVIAYSPLAHGIDHIKEKDPSAILSKVAAVTGKTEAQVALNWCISRENVIAIPKASSVEHVVQNCNASGWRLSSEENRLLEERVKFRRRGRAEAALRRAARAILQRLNHNQ